MIFYLFSAQPPLRVLDYSDSHCFVSHAAHKVKKLSQFLYSAGNNMKLLRDRLVFNLQLTRNRGQLRSTNKVIHKNAQQKWGKPAPVRKLSTLIHGSVYTAKALSFCTV